MTTKSKFNQPLQAEEMEEEKLTPNQVKGVIKDRQVMTDLDKIRVPMEVQIYTEKRWTYRNDEYRKMVSKMDIKAKEEMDKIIKENQ